MKKALVIFVVILAIGGFIALSVFVMYKTCKTTGNVNINDNLLYVANFLTGLIGGIVALGFGIPAPNGKVTNDNLLNRKMLGLGGLVVIGNLFPERSKSKSPVGTNEDNNLNAKRILGFTYALSYIIIGVVAIVIWSTDDKPPEIIKNISTVFLGMITPIVVGFFKGDS
jgi:heme A synthase